ncbi:hypothetical protein BHM03_00001880 [Ensete ventricosum]|nr:hypothetical protein BHM03_00001880 [Ensete ventricosum]
MERHDPTFASVQGKLCASAPCSIFYIDSLRATWILHQVPPKLLRLSICIELMVALTPTIPHSVTSYSFGSQLDEPLRPGHPTTQDRPLHASRHITGSQDVEAQFPSQVSNFRVPGRTRSPTLPSRDAANLVNHHPTADYRRYFFSIFFLPVLLRIPISPHADPGPSDRFVRIGSDPGSSQPSLSSLLPYRLADPFSLSQASLAASLLSSPDASVTAFLLPSPDAAATSVPFPFPLFVRIDDRQYLSLSPSAPFPLSPSLFSLP